MRALLGLVGILLVAAPESPVLQVRLELAGDWPSGMAPSQARLLLRPASDLASEPKVTPVDAVPGRVSIPVPPGGAHVLSAVAAGTWSPEVEVDASRASREVILRLYPKGQLTGLLVPPPNSTLPEALEVRMDRAPAAKQPEQVTTTFIQCPVREGRFNCELPAGHLDLRVRLAGSAAQYFWGAEIRPGQIRDVGDVQLRPGASVSGWVETSEGKPIAGARAELRPESPDLLQSQEDRQRTDRQRLSATTNERGFFQIAGVPRGQYRLGLSRDGLVAAELPSVEVREGLESHLRDPIKLDSPATVVLSLVPPADPYGRPWHIRFIHEDHRLKRSASGDVPESGSLRMADLAPGGYWLNVLDTDGARWVEEFLTLSPGPNQHAAEVPLLEVRGAVTQGGHGLAATLLMSSREQHAAQVKLGSDVDGQFEGYLPGEGTWEVQVVLDGGRTRVGLEPIEIRRQPGKSYAEVRLRVPKTAIAGKVVSEAGAPVEGAEVRAGTALRGRGETLTTSDDEGEFSLRGLPEGTYVLFARAEDERESDGVPVSVDEELDPPEVTLTLRSEREIQGVVRSRMGGVPGATVIAIPEMAGLGAASLQETYTGAGGVFRTRVPSAVNAATLVVAAPGFAVRILRGKLPPSGQPLIVEVDGAGGTVSLAPDVLAPAAPSEPQPMPILFHDDAAVPLVVMLRFTDVSRRRIGQHRALELPNLESGSYMLCQGRDATRAWREGSGAPRDTCSSGFLPPSGVLQLN